LTFDAVHTGAATAELHPAHAVVKDRGDARPLPFMESAMFPYLENASANPALRAQFDAQAGVLATLSQRSYDLFARVSELNMQLARQTIDDVIDTGRQMAACSDPFQLGATAMHGWQPMGEHLRSYGQNLMGVLADAGAGLGQVAAQAPAAFAANSAAAVNMASAAASAASNMANAGASTGRRAS
jgi:phasin family protein